MALSRTPTPLEMFTRKTQFRPPRISKDEHGKDKKDSPESEYIGGASVVALGLSALAFARLRLRRASTEKVLIQKMWDQHTTVKGLKLAAEAGKTLPETVMVRGWLSARGPPVSSLAAKVPQLSAHQRDLDRVGAQNCPKWQRR